MKYLNHIFLLTNKWIKVTINISATLQIWLIFKNKDPMIQIRCRSAVLKSRNKDIKIDNSLNKTAIENKIEQAISIKYFYFDYIS